MMCHVAGLGFLGNTFCSCFDHSSNVGQHPCFSQVFWVSVFLGLGTRIEESGACGLESVSPGCGVRLCIELGLAGVSIQISLVLVFLSAS